jgi:RNA polymerase sigma factor (sigma-70 family)
MNEREFRERLAHLMPGLRIHLEYERPHLDEWQRADILQTALLWALENWRKFRPERGSLSAWMKMAVMRRVATNHVRGCARDRIKFPGLCDHRGDPLVEKIFAGPNPTSQPYVSLDIENAFAALPPDEQAVALAVFLDTENIEAAGNRLGISKRTCERRLARAREKLQASLACYLDERGDIVGEPRAGEGRTAPKQLN